MANPGDKKNSLAAVRKALIEAGGIQTHAARALGISRPAMFLRVQRNPALQTLIADTEAAIGPIARDTIFAAIMEGDTATARWWLERKDPSFKPTMAVRLDDDALRDIIDQVAAAGGAAGLRDILRGG